MKKLRSWDQYVAESARKHEHEQQLELPLTDDESFVINYPSRAQGKKIQDAQLRGDTDALLIALLGEQAGQRVIELSDPYPSHVLDELLSDVLRKFGFLDDDDEDDTPSVVETGKPHSTANSHAQPKRRQNSSAASS